MLGFRGHISTTSRSYSTTLGALRAARRAWRTEQARVHANRPEHDPDTTLVIGHWAYLGTGYAPAPHSSQPPSGIEENSHGSSSPEKAADHHACAAPHLGGRARRRNC